MVQEKISDIVAIDKRLFEGMSATPDKYPNKTFKPKVCRNCGSTFNPVSPSNHFCSKQCRFEAFAANRYKRLHGVDGKDVLQMFNDQGGLCKICGKEGFKMHKSKKHGLNLDHCHTTGKIRGWLCDNCNRGLGLFKDDIANLERAIEYLKSSRDAELERG